VTFDSRDCHNEFPLLREIRNAIGTDDSSTNIKAGAAARAKKASDEADHTEVASVLNSSGPNIIVAGNSFMATRKTRAPAERMPGLIRGRVTDRIVSRADLPKPRDASSSLGSICSKDDAIDPRAIGKKSTMYAISRSHTVWYIGCAMAAPKYTRDRATTMPGNAYTAKPRVFTVRLINPGYRTNRAATGIEHVTVVIAASIET
jgi:hypothetical protein